MKKIGTIINVTLIILVMLLVFCCGMAQIEQKEYQNSQEAKKSILEVPFSEEDIQGYMIEVEGPIEYTEEEMEVIRESSEKLDRYMNPEEQKE